MRAHSFGRALSSEIGRLADDVERLQEILGGPARGAAAQLDIRAQCLDELTQRARALETVMEALADDMEHLQCTPGLLAAIPLGELKRRLSGEASEPAPDGGELELF